MTTLTPEQRAFIITAARNQGAAQAVLLKARALGLNGLPAIVALLSASANAIEATFEASERVGVLDTLLAETIVAWGGPVWVEPSAVAPAIDRDAPVILLRLLRDMGFHELPAITVLLTAATVLIETVYDPEHRAVVLGAVMAPKVLAWRAAHPETCQ